MIDLEGTTLRRVLESHARTRPSAPALLSPTDASFSYAQLLAAANRMRDQLASSGLGAHSRIALLLPTGLPLALASIAVACNATALPLHPGLTPPELEALLREARVDAVLGLPGDAVAQTLAQRLGAQALSFDLPLLLLPPAEAAQQHEDLGPTPAPGDTAFVLFTSGTSGKSKRVPLTHEQVLASARNIAQHLDLAPEDRGLLLMPVFHGHGLIGGLLTPLVAGSSVVCAPGFEAARFLHWMADFCPTWYTAAPSIHQAIIDLAARRDAAWPQHRLRFARSASSALPSRLMRDLEALWQVPVIEAYAMTEAATQMAGNPLPPGIRKPGSVGPPAGARIRVVDAQGRELPCNTEGRIEVRGPALFGGYEDAPALTAESFRDGWFITGDLGWLDADGYLFIAGRSADLINRGGEKIAPREIELALLALPAVAQAAAYPAPHPTLGEDVHAAVVLARDNEAADPQALRQALFGTLAEFKIPARIHVLETLPAGTAGKLMRRQMHEQLQSIARTSTHVTEAGRPLTPLQARVAACFAKTLRLPEGSGDASFLELGGDSLSAARLALALSREFGVDIRGAEVLSAPTVAEMAAHVQRAMDEAPPHRREPHGANDPALAPRQEDDGTAPLLLTQEGIWFVDQLGSGNAAYNIHSSTRLKGQLDPARLERALRALLARHPGLRTGFHQGATEPRQRPIPAALAIERFELRHIDAADGTDDETRRIAALVAEPFDLSHAPLLRAALLRISGEHHVLVLVAHHIAVDRWSMNLIHRDLAQLYASDDPGLPALELVPGELALSQRRRFERGDMRHALDYWRGKLGGVQTLQLPTDTHGPPATSGTAGKTHAFGIDEEVATALRMLATQHRVTLFTALLAAFQALLLRYTGQADIAIGVPVAGREDPRLLDAVGQFVNTVVVRTDLQGQPTFAELLHRNRTTVVEALTHQQMPFERLVAQLEPERELGHNPLYRVSFSLENLPDRLLALPGLKCERVDAHSGGAKFDLSLTVVEAGPGAPLQAELEYRTDLFTERFVARMATHLRNLLAALVAEPQCAITRAAMMDAAEQRTMLVEWNGTSHAPLDKFRGVHALFRAQAGATPGAIALRRGHQVMRYDQLDALSDWLAHDLRQRGVAPGCVVGLCMPRCFGLVVGLLAVFKAGGTYLPLDSELPAERLQAMLEDAAPRFVLADAHVSDSLRRLDAAQGFEIIEVPADGGTMPPGAAPELGDLAGPGHVAYLIFTSGSTGTPKAAQLTHEGLTNHVRWMRRTLALTASDRVLHKTSSSFDASLCEFFPPLASGAQIVLAPPDAHRDMHRLVATLHAEDVSVVQFVPSELRVALDEALMARCTALRYVLCGGEALDRDLALAFRRCLPTTRLGNFYGPTEATIDSAFHEVAQDVQQRPFVPIGAAVDNAQLYVLDEHMQPQPANVPGDLYVAGLGVGLGYLNRPDESARRFLPNPFRPGERMYRTGDRARWLDTGVVEYIGRDDQQVKLRGFRIELGEIEAAIHACPGVRICAALLREDVPGQREIVAYVVPDHVGDADAHRLRSQLRARLPEHMLPAAFVFLPHLPRLASGKIDRGKLPRPVTHFAASDRTAPRSPLEEELHDIWQRVLGKQGFGVRMNFFDLGGHSLLATQIASRVRSLFKVELPLRSLFEHPTVEGLARHLEGHLESRAADASAALAPIEVVPRSQPTMVSFSQRRIWLLHEMDPLGAAYNMCEALRLRGHLQHAALRLALDQMVLRHEAFRTTFTLGESEPMAVVGEAQPAVLIELDGRDWDDQEAEFERQAAQFAGQPFDLAHGPLHRFLLVRLGEQDHALVMVMHHMIGDGWAWSILLRELQALYGAVVRGKAAALPARAFDFIDFACWQRQHIGDEALAAQTRYWMEQLAGWAPLNLPTDTAVDRRTGSQGARARLDLPQGWIERLQRFSAQRSLSPFMSLLAAFQFFLSRYCGQDDVAVGTPIAGRTRIEAEEVVGSLINTLVLRARIQPEQDFHALLAQVRETCLSAFAHQDVPLDYIVGRLRAEDRNIRVPELRAMFNVLNARRESVQMEGLDVNYLSFNLGASEFDLGLTVDVEGERAMFLAYSTELFSAQTAQAMLENYAHLLERLIEAPDTQLRTVALPGPRELELLASWNRTGVDFPRGQTVHGLLSVHGASTAVALRQLPGTSLQYAQLWSGVHRLAHALRSRGVQRGTLVGLCLERDPGMVVAQLAVLAAGAAYVPLDPAYPRQRLHDMASDAGLALLLLTRQDQATLWQGLALPTMLLDSPADIADFPDTALAPDPARDAGPDDPAYVIYTSGSTGKPKGVAVPHRAAVNFLLSMQREPGLRAEDVLVAVTTLSFDISVLELLLPLSIGATVVIATREQTSGGEALRELLEQSQATVMQATPSTWQLLTDTGWAGGPGFKALIGGESLGAHMALTLSVRAGQLWNLYGPTETTVWSTCWQVPRTAQRISIGRPIANTRIHVLDEHGHPCPVGVSGEIFIGGDGVALGYLQRPELTAERFVPEPFGAAPGARMYKTGDRGRWRRDGTLEHQGRLDHQVKLRGHRIEPGEIEAQLQAHPSVSQCLVTVREDRAGDARLVAYVVTASGSCDAVALKDHLRATLPAYMLPQHFVGLKALPLLPNGKVDRHALPPPGREAREAHGGRQANRSAAENALAAIWAEVLDMEVDDIAAQDNFFDLGGDSLKVSRIVVMFERKWGVRVESRRFVFESLSQLAAGIELEAMRGAAVKDAVASNGGRARGWWKRLAGMWR